MNNILTMSTFTESDFQEFEYVISKNINLEKFVSSLNYLVDNDIENEICDLYVMIQQFKRYPLIYKELLKLIQPTIHENNTLIVWLYCKFSLLDKEHQKIILSKIEMIDDTKFRSKSMKEVMRLIFEIAEDEILDNFMDYRENNSRLDISQININISITNFDTMKKILIRSREYFRIKFIYKLVYFISDFHKTNCLQDGETYIDSFQDFLRRFELNIQTHVKFFLGNSLFYCEKYQDNCPNYSYTKRVENILAVIKEYENFCKYEINKIIFVSYNLGDINATYNTILEKEIFNYNPIRTALKILFNYEKMYPDDNYKLVHLSQYNKIHSDILRKKIFEYKTSKIYISLENIFLAKASLFDIMQHQTTKKQREELESYLQNILKTYHFDKFLEK
jgi:hypothetical protein